MFKCSGKQAVIEYANFSKIYYLDKYKLLYAIEHAIWNKLPFIEKNYEDGIMFIYDNMLCCVDKENGSYCEIIGTGWLPIPDRIKIHLRKLRQLNEKN